MSNIFPLYARQPIFNRKREVIAYELLFRGPQTGNTSGVINGDQATAEVILKVFGERPIEEVTDGHLAFINFTRNLLLSPPILPKEKLVVEVLEDIEPDDEVLSALAKLKKRGFTIALDDFLLTEKSAKFIPFADIIKVDILALSTEKLKIHVKKLSTYKTKLLAEKVEDHAAMKLCEELGFDFFQGYFLCKPEIIKGVRVSEGKQSVLNLVSQLNDENIELSEIVQTIATDPALSFKILRLVNSPAIGLKREIESLSQAVTLLGMRSIRNWATYLLLANNDNKPIALCVITMCRAKFCELIGKEIGGRSMGDSCFTAGLLTNIDAFLDMPMNEVLTQLKLSAPVSEAILNKTGVIGEILEAVQHYERGNWAEVNWALFESKNVQMNTVNHFYGESILWASQMVTS